MEINLLSAPYISALIVLILGGGYTVWAIKNKNESLIQNIPQVWTALGVLGTFVTLFINLGLKDLPYLEIKEAGKITKEIDIANLINNLTGAFSTSIVGVLASIISSAYIKWKFDPKKADGTKEWEHKDERELLFEIVKELKDNQKKNDFILDSLNTNIKDIKDNIAGNIADLINKFEENLENHLKKIGSESLEKTIQLTSEFNSQYQTQLKELIENNQNIFNRSVEQSEHKLSEITTQMQEKVSEAMIEFSKAVEKFQSSTDNMNKLFENYISSTKDGFDDISNKFTETAENIQENTSKSINNFSTEVNQVTEKYKETLESLNDKIITDTTKLLSDNVSILKDSFAKLEEYQISAQQTLEQTTNKFRETVENYEEIQVGEQDSIDLLKENIKKIDLLLNDRKNLVQNISDITELIPELTDYMETVNYLLENMQTIKVNNGDKFKIISLNGTQES